MSVTLHSYDLDDEQEENSPTPHHSSSPERPLAATITPPLRARKFPHPQMGSLPLTDALSAAHGGGGSCGSSPQSNPKRSSTFSSSWLASNSDELLPPPFSSAHAADDAQDRNGGSTTTRKVSSLSASPIKRLESPDRGMGGPSASQEAAMQSSSGAISNLRVDVAGQPHAGGNTPISQQTTPTLQAQCGGIDNAAVDVQGFYSQHQVNGVPVIPQELPRSQVLYILTTSEGRDKLFKCLQYSLKICIWVLHNQNILPEGAAPFATTLAERLAANVLTIRHGRSMFKLGRWIITLFHLQVINARLMKKHTPQWYARLLAFQDAVGEAFETMQLWLLRSFGMAPSADASVAKPAAGSGRAAACVSPEGSASLESSGRGGPLPCHGGGVPAFYTDGGGGEAHRGAQRSGVVSPNRQRTVTFPALPPPVGASPTHSDGTSPPFLAMTQERPFTTPPPPRHDQEEPTLPRMDLDAPVPGSYAYAMRWRRSADDFATPWMLLLAARCTLSVARNVMRDALFLSSKEFILSPSLATRQGTLQRVVNGSWMVVSMLDLALNTWRLCDKGWFKYVDVRHSHRNRCMCTVLADGSRSPSQRVFDAHHHTHHRLSDGPQRGGRAGSNAAVVFAPLDLDFGAVTPTTAKFFEAAEPQHLSPICASCGYVICDTESTSTTPKSSASNAPSRVLLVPWLVRRGFDILWTCARHANLTHTLLLEARYLSDVVISFGYSLGDFEPAAGEAPLAQHLHLTASVAGLVSALVALHRVRISTS